MMEKILIKINGKYKLIQWKSMSNATKTELMKALDEVLSGKSVALQAIVPRYLGDSE